MKVTLQLTGHKTTLAEQHKKIYSELKEYVVEYKNNKPNNTIDELIDLAKTALKQAKNLCDIGNECLEHKIKLNDEKNEKRGYHDASTFN